MRALNAFGASLKAMIASCKEMLLSCSTSQSEGAAGKFL
jgi:hypothetical protein